MEQVEGKKVVAVVIAHPDDMDHSMGGTAWLLKGAYQLHVICATKGERGIEGASLKEAGAIRQKEQEAACELLGAGLTFLGRIDGELYADKGVCEEVAGLLGEMRPAAVFTLWPINEHPDHVAIFDITMRALRIAGIYRETEIYLAENAMGTQTNQFDPDVYVDISGVIEGKRRLAAVPCVAEPGRGGDREGGRQKPASRDAGGMRVCGGVEDDVPADGQRAAREGGGGDGGGNGRQGDTETRRQGATAGSRERVTM